MYLDKKFELHGSMHLSKCSTCSVKIYVLYVIFTWKDKIYEQILNFS